MKIPHLKGLLILLLFPVITLEGNDSLIDVLKGDQYEPDNSSSTATPIALNDSQMHSINPTSDQDWGRFTLTKASSLQLVTSGLDDNDTRIWLYDSALTQLAFDDDDGENTYSLITYNCSDPLPAGTYYFKIDEYGQDNIIPEYTLSFQNVISCSGSNNNNSATIIPIILDLLLDAE